VSGAENSESGSMEVAFSFTITPCALIVNQPIYKCAPGLAYQVSLSFMPYWASLGGLLCWSLKMLTDPAKAPPHISAENLWHVVGGSGIIFDGRSRAGEDAAYGGSRSGGGRVSRAKTR
jgi:hypothetical protein